ncbi:MAG TPA: alpha/beta hydrolase [Thermoanaerobaculia bacterium]|nr:alpha/beta hydrolase [Thermoanaerobaculia bacterium]
MFTEVLSDRGQGPALIYLPGIDGSGQLLFGTAARLEQRFRLLRLRYRLSANPEHRTYHHLAASAVETVSLRGVDRMLLLAESFGGAVALRAALDFPSSVAGLALVNAFPHFRHRARLGCSRIGARCTPAWMLSFGRRLFGPRLLFGGAGEADAIAEFLGAPPRDATPGDPPGPWRSAPRAWRGAGPAWTMSEGYPARLQMIQRLDLRGELGRVRQPVALFASTRDRIVDSVRQAREMARLLPDAELEILEGRGHIVLPVAEIDWPARMERLAERSAVRGAEDVASSGNGKHHFRS